MRCLEFSFKSTVYSSLLIMSLFFMSVSHADVTYKVKKTDNLSKIVKKHYPDSKLNSYQIYIGLLAENPSAFRFGNINYLKSGSLLNIPASSDLIAMEPTDAANLIAEHNDNAKQGRKTQIDAPFQNYSTSSSQLKNGSNASNENNEIKQLAAQQQTTSEQLQKLDSEREELRVRMEQLLADKEAMDAELLQLNSLLKK